MKVAASEVQAAIFRLKSVEAIQSGSEKICAIPVQRQAGRRERQMRRCVQRHRNDDYRRQDEEKEHHPDDNHTEKG
jgi:hypothetical protein